MLIRNRSVRKNTTLFLFAIALFCSGQGISSAQNTAPVFPTTETGTRSVAENTAAGTNIGAPSPRQMPILEILIYTLGGTPDAPTDYEAFDIVSTSGQLQTKAELDFETQRSYEVTVTVTDGTDTVTIIVTITITNVIETPVSDRTPEVRDAILAAAQLADSAVMDYDDVTVEHLATIYFLDLTDQGITALKSGDFEGLTALTYLDLGTNQFSELPRDIFNGLTELIFLILNENQLIGAPVTATDDDGETLTFSLDSDADATFDIDSGTGQLTTSAALDYETQRFYLAIVSASDGNDTTSITVYIDITNVNDAPLFPDTTVTALEVTKGVLTELTDVTITVVVTPVCDRTPKVRNAIVAAVPGVTDCADVTETHLAAITSLDVKHAGSLTVGDFEGLTALTDLDLNHNGLDTLPKNLFDGLTALEGLSVSTNGLTTLDADAFDGLTALEDLILSDNLLSSIDVDAFDGLTTLETLILSANRLSTLDADVFGELTALEELKLNNNSFSTLDADIFDGLTVLTTLDLSNNQFSTLPAGVPGFTKLDLSGNTVDPLPVTGSLNKVADGEFKATVHTGAPFELVLPITNFSRRPIKIASAKTGTDCF